MDNKRVIKEANRNKFLAGILNESLDMSNNAEKPESQIKELTREELDEIIKSKGYQPVWYRARRGEDYSAIVYIGRSTYKHPRGFKLGTKTTDFRGFEKKSFEIILPEDVDFFIKKGFEKNLMPNTTGDFDISYKLHDGADKIQIGSRFHVSSEGYTRSGYGSMNKGYEVIEDLGDDKYKCKVISDDTQTSVGNYDGSVGETDVFTKSQIIATDSLMSPEN